MPIKRSPKAKVTSQERAVSPTHQEDQAGNELVSPTSMNAQLAEAAAKLKSFRRKFTLLENETTAFLNSAGQSEANLEEANSLQFRLEKVKAGMAEEAAKIITATAACTPEDELEKQVDKHTDYMDRWAAIFAKLRHRFQAIERSQNSLQARSSTPQVNSFHEQAQVSVPVALKTPKFYGDSTGFREWWQIFEFNFHSKNFSPTQKLLFLKQHLGGSAAATIKHLDIEDHSYDLAIEIIKAKFGSTSNAEMEHTSRVLELCQREQRINHKFPNFVSTLYQHIHAILALGTTSEETLSNILVPQILKCLTHELRARFIRECKSITYKDQPKIMILLEILQAEAESIQAAGIPQGNRLVKASSSAPQKYRSAGIAETNRWQPPPTNRDFAFQASSSRVEITCIFCGKNHQSHKCKKEMTLEEKKMKVTENSACFRCLGRNHNRDKCRNNVKCSICGYKHYDIMCNQTSQGDNRDSRRSKNVFTGAAGSTKSATTALQTGYVWASANKKRKLVRILLDPGSQRTYVSKKLTDFCGLKPIDSILLQTFTIGGQVSEVERLQIFNLHLESQFNVRSSINISALALEEITKGKLPMVAQNFGKSEVADSVENDTDPTIEILLGADYLPKIHLYTEHPSKDVVATKTIFGWFFYGKRAGTADFEAVESTLSALRSAQPATKIETSQGRPETSRGKANLSSDIDFLWDTEVLGIEQPTNNSESILAQELNDFFKKSIKKLSSGHYEVSLPFKENVRSLGDNRNIALSRLKSFLKHAEKKERLLEAVDAEISDYINKGFAERAKRHNPDELAHYLPLLTVAKKSLSPNDFKIRVVKDAGCRVRDEASLNDVLHQGPNLLPEITKVVSYFRQQRIPIISDIEKAFLQFSINPEHRTFLRFFWPMGISQNPKAKILEFWATSLDFGLVCSPWLHCAGIKYHLDSQAAEQPKYASFIESVKNNFYMDDIVTGAESVEDGKTKVKLLNTIFSAGGFPLKKWATNSPELGRFIEKIFKEKEIKLTYQDTDFKFLGIRWNQVEDTLGVFTGKAVEQLKTHEPSKRALLKGLSQVYDPLGVICPIAINFKILLQKLWRQKKHWDETLAAAELKDYRTFTESLESAKNISIKRYSGGNPNNKSSAELHVFSDASLSAYGCVIYLRERRANNSYSVNFLRAKARVTPLKGDWNIHRLELVAALLAARIASKAKEDLISKPMSTHFWCDNASVLGWIRDSPERWKPFVANRIRDIHNLSKPEQWSYVKSEDNPADILSRGGPIHDEASITFWSQGPSWLTSCGFPFEYQGRIVAKLGDEAKIEKRQTVTLGGISSSDPLWDPARWSSWTKIVRTFAYALRFIRKCRRIRAIGDENAQINAEEFMLSVKAIIKSIQRSHFPVEQASRCKIVPKHSPLYQLTPFSDAEDIIRCRSRLEKSNSLTFEEKFPVILPGGDTNVKLLINWVHSVKCLHFGGITAVLHSLREEYFVIHARRAAKKVISECRVCKRFNAKAATEAIPPLPQFRIESTPPFTYTGVDFTGPIYVKNDTGSKVKSYIALFTCAVTRAVHLELVSDLSTMEFLLALRKFRNRFPSVSKIFSDNGGTFGRAAKELKTLFANIQENEIQRRLTDLRISWEFITPRSPWHGGWWERLVQSVKRPLRKILGTNIPPFRELQTILTDIELLLNNRPLTTAPTDANEIAALSPGDLLYGLKTKPPLPDTKRRAFDPENSDAIVLSKRWKHQQSIINAFWKRFHKEYLEYLRSAHRRTPTASHSIKIGDVCLLEDPAPSRAYWPLARVLALEGGANSDGRRRTCTIKLQSGQVVRRPIQLLYPLEI